MDQAATELKLFIDNDADLYRRHHLSIARNLATKKARGEYKHDLAVKLIGYAVEAGAKKYAKEHGTPGQPWHRMFPASTRRAVAEALTRDFEDEYALGGFDRLLPKKYQPKSVAHARKAKSMEDYEAEGYKAHTWYLADSPYTQPKIRDAWQRGAWKWQQEQRSLRPVKAPSHARKRESGTPKFTVGDIVRRTAARMRSMGLVSGPVNGIVVGYSGPWPLIRWSNMDEADEPMPQAVEGLELDKRAMSRLGHARKQTRRRSPAQLDREIADLVPSWRGGR